MPGYEQYFFLSDLNVKLIRFFYKLNEDRNDDVYLTATGRLALVLFSDPN
jgi:hypothetical protein